MSNRRRKNQRRPHRPAPPPLVTTDVNTDEVAIRLILDDLHDDPLRTIRLVRDLFAILENHGQGTIFAVIGYLLTQVTDGIIRGNGSREAAIDAVTSGLAAAVIANESRLNDVLKPDAAAARVDELEVER
jgi:hypothetical protein